VLTAGAAAVPVLAAVFWAGYWPLLLLATAAFLVGSWELAAIAELRDRVIGGLALALAAALLFWPVASEGPMPSEQTFAAIFAIVAAGGAFFAWRGAARGCRLTYELACLWIAAPLLSLFLLKTGFDPQGTWDFSTPLLLALVPIWVGDTAAMLVGRTWGRTLLAPKISPKKTVEGGIANLLGCIAAAAALGPWVGASWPAAIGCGVACGVLGQLGDLFQSSLKRAADLKDSGSVLPGHGGLLDRIDSLLFAAPVVAIILTLPGAVAR